MQNKRVNFELMKAQQLSNDMNNLSDGISAATQMLGNILLVVCLLFSAYLLFKAYPALSALPVDLPPTQVFGAVIRIDGMIIAPLIAGFGISGWWRSRPGK